MGPWLKPFPPKKQNTVSSRQAAQDLEAILDWTLEQSGPLPMEANADVINDALMALSDGPPLIGASERPELGDDMGTLHVTHNGHKGRNPLVFRADEAACLIEILRILRDSMDLQRHLQS